MTTLKPARDEPAIALENLSRRMGQELVLNGVNLEVAAGRVVVLRGSNGSGKTTLLKVLATRLRPTRGEARVFGHDSVREAAAVREKIGMLSVMGGSYPVLNASENLHLAASLGGASKQRVPEALEQVGLEDAGSKLVRTFSSGMKKRLGLARLLLLDPDLWLLDEPYAALDGGGKELVDAVVAAARGRGRSVLMASHEGERASLKTDAVLELAGGKLQALVPA